MINAFFSIICLLQAGIERTSGVTVFDWAVSGRYAQPIRFLRATLSNLEGFFHLDAISQLEITHKGLRITMMGDQFC